MFKSEAFHVSDVGWRNAGETIYVGVAPRGTSGCKKGPRIEPLQGCKHYLMKIEIENKP